MSDDVIRIKTRVKYQGAWMPWRELANDYSIVNALGEKAPGGFGLGSAYTDYIADFNACIKNGWYRAYSNSLNSPSIGGWNARYGALLVSTRDSTIYHVYYVERYSVMYTLERYSNDDGTTWSEWEYVNPPMDLGVEYRTTERYMSKPVYVKTVDTGALPNATYKEISASFPNADKVLSIYGSAYQDSEHLIPLPCLRYGSDSYNTTNAVQVTVNTTTSITISTAIDMSSFSKSSVCVKYTKSTD